MGDATTQSIARLVARAEIAERDLAKVRSDLVLALPTEDEREVLRWIREVLQDGGAEVLHNIRYPAALELLQRLLTMKVNHNG